MMLTYQQFDDSYKKLVQFFTDGVYQEELQQAKKDFFSNTGTLDESKSNYNLRMNQFFDWYFLTRKLKSHMQTPLAVVKEQRSLRLTDEDLQTLNVLSQLEHSIYEFIKQKNDKVIIRNLLTGQKIEMTAGDHIYNFDPKESFEARIVTIDKEKYFLKGFCFHPESAMKYIQDEIKVFKKNPDLDFKEFMMRLNKMRYKLEQYRHIKPELVYTNENKLKL